MKGKKFLRFRPAYLIIPVVVMCIICICEALFAESMQYGLDFIGYGGTFKYTGFSVGGISTYWITMIIGTIICVYISVSEAHEYKVNKVLAGVIPVGFLLMSLMGAKLLYAVETMFSDTYGGVSFAGLSLYGAIFIFPLVAFLIARFDKKRFALILDYCTPFELTLLICVRVGCFLSGCCGATTIWRDTTPVVLPVQLFEVLFDILIFELCIKVKRSRGADGRMYPMFMMVYGIVRFMLEFLRNTPKEVLGFSNGQIFSVVSFIVGLAMFTWIKKGFAYKKRNHK